MPAPARRAAWKTRRVQVRTPPNGLREKARTCSHRFPKNFPIELGAATYEWLTAAEIARVAHTSKMFERFARASMRRPHELGGRVKEHCGMITCDKQALAGMRVSKALRLFDKAHRAQARAETASLQDIDNTLREILTICPRATSFAPYKLGRKAPSALSMSSFLAQGDPSLLRNLGLKLRDLQEISSVVKRPTQTFPSVRKLFIEIVASPRDNKTIIREKFERLSPFLLNQWTQVTQVDLAFGPRSFRDTTLDELQLVKIPVKHVAINFGSDVVPEANFLHFMLTNLPKSVEYLHLMCNDPATCGPQELAGLGKLIKHSNPSAYDTHIHFPSGSTAMHIRKRSENTGRSPWATWRQDVAQFRRYETFCVEMGLATGISAVRPIAE